MPNETRPLPRGPAGVRRDVEARIAALATANPDWRPLLGLLAELWRPVDESGRLAVQRGSATPADDPTAGESGRASRARSTGEPVLHRRHFTADAAAVSHLVGQLVRGLAPKERTLHRVIDRASHDRLLSLVVAAIEEDHDGVDQIARDLGLPTAVTAILAKYATIPLLIECASCVAPPVAQEWPFGHCPVCGAWPVLAEVRGVEQARRLRCGRCGADWAGEWLRCTFCGEREHTRLGTLVGESELASAKVDTCAICRGYLKTTTTLRPAAPLELSVVDLETIELDLVARERGFARPQGLGVPLQVRIIASPDRR